MPIPLIWMGVSALVGGALGFGSATATNGLLKWAITAVIAWWIWTQFVKPMVKG